MAALVVLRTVQKQMCTVSRESGHRGQWLTKEAPLARRTKLGFWYQLKDLLSFRSWIGKKVVRKERQVPSLMSYRNITWLRRPQSKKPTGTQGSPSSPGNHRYTGV